MSYVDATLAAAIFINVVIAGIGLECARKLGKRIFFLPLLWRMCQRQLPGVTDVLLCFVDIWDQFRSSSLDFEARFAIFCDRIGDYLESVLDKFLDYVDIFTADPLEEKRRLKHLPCARVGAADRQRGLGRLRVSSCAICLEDWRVGDVARMIPACGHAFHARCADGWLAHYMECPMCRTSVKPEVR